MTQPNFKVDHATMHLIHKVVQRAEMLYNKFQEEHPDESSSEPYDKLSAEMDLCACMNSCPLDLFKLLKFDDFNFLHDIVGIRDHMNRETGELERNFLPRSSRDDRPFVG